MNFNYVGCFFNLYELPSISENNTEDSIFSNLLCLVLQFGFSFFGVYLLLLSKVISCLMYKNG